MPDFLESPEALKNSLLQVPQKWRSPFIIIYPAQGKKNAEWVLAELYCMFVGKIQGIEAVPRFSVKIDNCFSYSLGCENDKVHYIGFPEQTGYSKDFVFYHENFISKRHAVPQDYYRLADPVERHLSECNSNFMKKIFFLTRGYDPTIKLERHIQSL